MSEKDTKDKGKEQTKAEGRQDFAEMCGRMMSGAMADCCGPQMREMMSRLRSWAGKRKGEAEG
jgi:hypothetical protein